jgi:hypothetical protein
VKAHLVAIIACGAVVSLTEQAQSAAFFPNHTVGAVDVVATLQQASRWSSVSGLDDGIQVGVMPGFAEALGAANAGEVALIEGAVAGALAAWSNAALQFDITYDAATVEGTGSGFEIDLFAAPDTHPAFNTNSFFGVAFVDDAFVADRPLTNGQAFDGFAITGADVYICIERVLAFSDFFGLTQEQEIAALQRLLMHELGHALGMGHPNENPTRNFDDDNDPLNVMNVSPLDPFTGVIVSPNTDDNAIMSNDADFAFLFQTFLANDDLAGRDLLYPVVPEPGSLLLAAVGFGGLVLARCYRRGCRAARRRGA